jgi:uncharacterized membrane protein
MDKDVQKLSRHLMGQAFESLTQSEKFVLQKIADRLQISRNVIKEYEEQSSFGQRLADKVAAFGGSWAFIILFGGILLTWIGLNSFVLIGAHKAFDPYPYILLNLVLSMLAAFQAPVIMMSQNRQSAKDRADAAHDYEVNLKAELEIAALHEKIDAMRQKQMEQLLGLQRDQLDMIKKMIEHAESKMHGRLLDDESTPSEQARGAS